MRYSLVVILLFLIGSVQAELPVPQLLASVNSVELASKDGNQIIFSGNEVIDIYGLYDGIDLFFVNESITPGTFNAIRFYVSNVELCEPEPIGSSTVVCINVQVGGNRIDLVPVESFTIASGDVVSAKVDSNAKEPIKVKEGRRKTTLRKVVKVEIESQPSFDTAFSSN
jgi:hypothetical protein